jgi:uncharacterized membrane protein YdjX (TVP38/TMEM64 family)
MSSPAPSPTPSPHWPRLLLAAGLVLAVVGFYAFGLNHHFTWEAIRANLDAWKAHAEANLWLALAVFFLVYVALTALSLPVAVWLTLIGAALFGRWTGTAVVSLASTAGATLAFLGSRYLLGDWVQRRFGDRLEPLHRGVDRDGAYYLFTLRLVVLVPFWLVNLGMGLTRMPVGTYTLVSWAGMLPGTFLYVNAGAALTSAQQPRDLVSPGVLASLALLGIVPLLIRLAVRRRGTT